MKYLIFLVLTFSIYTFAINVDGFAQISASKEIQELTEGSNIGQFLMGLAQLHGQVQAPLNDLKEAISKLADNLQSQLQELEATYSRKQALYNKAKQNLEVNIGQVQIEIAQSEDLVDNFLIPTKANYEDRLKEVKANIEDNRKNVERSKLERQKGHEQKMDHIHEHQLAINAIDESLQLVAGLMKGNIAFAEAPMHKTIQFVESRINNKEEFAPMIEALLNMSENLNDLQTVKSIRDLLNKLRNNIVDSLNNEMAQDKEDDEQFIKRSDQLQSEYQVFQKQINELTYNLTAFMNRIEREKGFSESRKNDLQLYLQQQDLENSNMAEETNLYQEVKQALLKEIQTCSKASEIVSTSQYQDLIRQKANTGPLI